MCLMYPVSEFEQESTPNTISDLPTFVGWRFFEERGDGYFYSPMYHNPRVSGYKLGKILQVGLQTHEAKPIGYSIPAFGSHPPGFFIFPTRAEAMEALHCGSFLCLSSVLAEVRYAKPVAFGRDDSAQRCVVAELMVIDKIHRLNVPLPTT